MATWQEVLEYLLDPLASPFGMIETLGIRPSRLRELLAGKRLQATLAVMQEVAMLRARHRAACGAPVAMERLIELSANSLRETTALRASQAVYRAAERAQAWREALESGQVHRRRRSAGGGGSAGDDVEVRDSAVREATRARSGPGRNGRRRAADGPPLKVILPPAPGPGEAAFGQASAARHKPAAGPVAQAALAPVGAGAAAAPNVDAIFEKEARRCRCLELRMYGRAKAFPDLVAEGLTKRLVVTEDTPLAAWEIAAEEASQEEGAPPESWAEVPPAAWESAAEADSSPDSPPEGAAEREAEPSEQASGDDVAIGNSAAGDAARTTAEDDVAIGSSAAGDAARTTAEDDVAIGSSAARHATPNVANLCEPLRNFAFRAGSSSREVQPIESNNNELCKGSPPACAAGAHGEEIPAGAGEIPARRDDTRNSRRAAASTGGDGAQCCVNREKVSTLIEVTQLSRACWHRFAGRPGTGFKPVPPTPAKRGIPAALPP